MIAVLQHRIGDFIQDRYEILDSLVSGAFGTVYGCRDSELDTPVAIKELHVLDLPGGQGGAREAALAQFRREAINLSLLRHPHIVSGHYQPHHGTWLVCPTCGFCFRASKVCPRHACAPLILRQRHYLVMEYVDGPNLQAAATAAGGALPVPAAVRYMSHIAQALQLIHGRGWVHRDVKPDNIRLRTVGDDAVLLDFGIASESGAAGEFSTRVQRHTHGGGTLGYAPESAAERRLPDARSDLHALGMTLYRLVSGRDPQEAADLVAMKRGRPSDFNRAVPAALDELILRCIEANPARRPQSAAEVARLLTDVLEPVKPVPAPVPAPAAPEPLILPFTFANGATANNVTQLARLMDQFPAEAVDYLFHGDLAPWLMQIGRDDLASRARLIGREYSHRRRQGLEAFLQATGVVGEPGLRIEPDLLDFGTMWIGQSRTLQLDLCNDGRGYLFGFSHSRYPGLLVESEFEGNRVSLPVTLNTRDLRRGEHQGDVIIDSSGGEVLVPFSATLLKKRSWAPLFTVVLWATLGMLCGQWLRAFPFFHAAGVPGWNWLQAGKRLTWYPAAPLFGVALWGVLMLVIAGEATRRRSCGFLFLAGSFAAFCALLGMAFGDAILMAGDAALRPSLQEIVHGWAAGGWMFVGCLLGAAYGTMRRWRDVFSTRILQVVGGWLISVFLLYAVLVTVILVVHPLH